MQILSIQCVQPWIHECWWRNTSGRDVHLCTLQWHTCIFKCLSKKKIFKHNLHQINGVSVCCLCWLYFILNDCSLSNMSTPTSFKCMFEMFASLVCPPENNNFTCAHMNNDYRVHTFHEHVSTKVFLPVGFTILNENGLHDRNL